MAIEYKWISLMLAVAVILLLLTGYSPAGNYQHLVSKSISGTTGKLYKMIKTREFKKSQLRKVSAPRKGWNEGKQCKQWAVSTTIFEPSKTLFQLAKLPNWCVLVVLDKKTPAPFTVPGATILDVEDQIRLPYRIGKRLPWNHFGRKNVGYLHAIANGAEIIYDVDDDNELILEGDELRSIPVAPTTRVLAPRQGSTDLFNPYPSFGNVGGWPRGYPLDQILNKTTYTNENMQDVTSQNNFYVHQSLANNDPDYDALYRLTRPLPVTFKGANDIALPSGTFCPYNAQATLHMKAAFWGMLLPITVHGRVSDIWRSYITQRLLWDIDGRIVFRKPWAVQYRNAHSYLADFDSELDLYRKSTALVEYLKGWNSQETDLGRRIVQLCIDLYEREIIEEEDVMMMGDWVQDLKQAGYEFPQVIV